MNKEIKINETEFVQLRDYIYSLTGIFIANNKKYLLQNRLANRLKANNLQSFGEYYYFLKYDPGKNQELKRLFAVITTNETSFYRNPQQLKIFQKEILPAVIEDKKRKRQKKLRIWSAGCSTGEEPYTLAIILYEVLGNAIKDWDIKLLAHDLSEDVIETAKKGVYTDYTLRNTPEKIIRDYFCLERDGKYKVNQKLRELISFGTVNLIDRYQVKQIEASDVVFCRNVLIYFDETMKKRAINNIYDNILAKGYLFLGHSESLHNVSRALQPSYHSGIIVYVKE